MNVDIEFEPQGFEATKASLLGLIRNTMHGGSITHTSLALRIGVSQSTLSKILAQAPKRIPLDTLVRIATALGVPLELNYGYREPLANGSDIKARSTLPNIKGERWARELQTSHQGIAIVVSADADLAHRVLLSILDGLSADRAPAVVEHIVSHVGQSVNHMSLHETAYQTLGPALEASIGQFDRIMCGVPQQDGDLAAMLRLSLAGVAVAFPFAGSDITNALEDLVIISEREQLTSAIYDRISSMYFVRFAGNRVVADTLRMTPTIRRLVRNGDYGKVDEYVRLAGLHAA